MTKHLVDDGLPKYIIPLEETNKVLDHNLDLLENCNARLSRVPSFVPKRSELKVQSRMNSFKNRLGKIMHKLYDLEPDNAPEKPLNVELCVDLYQMENY